MEIDRKNAATQNLGPHFVRACAVDALQHFTRATLYLNLQEEPRTTLRARLRSRNALL